MHGTVSVSLILMNKTIAMDFPNTFVVVSLQNSCTVLVVPLLHFLGIAELQPLAPAHRRAIVINAVWLVGVLWASIKALQYVSVPLYVVVRNTVPFQTLVLEYFFLSRPIRSIQVLALVITFAGTMLYTMHDNTGHFTGLSFGLLNTLLVSTLTVYERALMIKVKSEMSALSLNFYRMLYSLPIVVGAAMVAEGPSAYSDLFFDSKNRWTMVVVLCSAPFGMSIGTLLLSLQGRTSATTIQVANIFYKFLTTVLSRFTHPSDVAAQGWLGYGLCTSGFCVYTFAPAPKKVAPEAKAENDKTQKKTK